MQVARPSVSASSAPWDSFAARESTAAAPYAATAGTLDGSTRIPGPIVVEIEIFFR
jgi:hypothetical protein